MRRKKLIANYKILSPNRINFDDDRLPTHSTDLTDTSIIIEPNFLSMAIHFKYFIDVSVSAYRINKKNKKRTWYIKISEI